MICILGILFLFFIIDWFFELSWWFFRAMIISMILLFLFTLSVDAREYDPAEIVLIGKVVHHEAENQSELGKRLVADTILNRVESPNFPNTVKEVVEQEGQYCNPNEFPPREIYTLVAQEIYSRTNNHVLYFRTKRYHPYGEPILKEGDHYFSGRIDDET
jgi:hypothetical protein